MDTVPQSNHATLLCLLLAGLPQAPVDLYGVSALRLCSEHNETLVYESGMSSNESGTSESGADAGDTSESGADAGDTSESSADESDPSESSADEGDSCESSADESDSSESSADESDDELLTYHHVNKRLEYSSDDVKRASKAVKRGRKCLKKSKNK